MNIDYYNGIEEIRENKRNKTALERIKIFGLFNRNHITLDFNKEVNIYIGENGLGKTTILNCVYYILNCECEKLINIPFSKILVKFKNKQEIIISKADVIKYSKKISRSYVPFDVEEIYAYISNLFSYSNYESMSSTAFKVAEEFGIPYSRAQMIVNMYIANEYSGPERKYISKGGNDHNISHLNDVVRDNIKERVIYLTTYRRIEKDYSDVFIQDKSKINRSDKSLIQFGMNDVSNGINNILNIIKDKNNQGFNKMTGVLLSLYANEKKFNKKENLIERFDLGLLKIVLDRLGSQISDIEKAKILEIVKCGYIHEPEYKNLRDLIEELILSYNQVKAYDEKIMRFKNVCNKYLNDKQFIYNPSEITLKMISSFNNEEIDLSMLSSGEKQIVSLFSKLYLESDDKCIMIVDEPELSISMRWQRMIIPDIMKSENCKLLLTVTHSPFIFDNEYDMDAIDMWNCMNNG